MNNDPYNTNYNTYNNEYQQQNYGQAPKDQQGQQLGVISFVLSFFIPIVALVMSIFAIKKINQTEEKEGKGLAIAALIISAIQVILTIALIVIFFLMMVFLNNYEVPEYQEYDSRCEQAICINDCIGENCPCYYYEEDGTQIEIYCD